MEGGGGCGFCCRLQITTAMPGTTEHQDKDDDSDDSDNDNDDDDDDDDGDDDGKLNQDHSMGRSQGRGGGSAPQFFAPKVKTFMHKSLK